MSAARTAVLLAAWLAVPAPCGAARRLVVGVRGFPPFAMKDSMGRWSGLGVELWDEIARDLKVDYEFRELGIEQMKEGLRRGKVDLCATPLALTPEREEAFDLSHPFYTGGMALALRPEARDHPWWAAIKIFFSWGTLSLLAPIGVAMVILGCFVWRLERRHNHEHFGGKGGRGILAGIYWVGSTFTSGTCEGVALKSPAGRVFALCWLLCCALALSTFTASLASTMVARQSTGRFMELSELKKIKIGAGGLSAGAELLRSVGADFTPAQGVGDGVRDVLEGRTDAFFAADEMLRWYRDHHPDERFLIEPVKMRRRSMYAFQLPARSGLRKRINVSLLKVLAMPVWDDLKTRYSLAEESEMEPEVRFGGHHHHARASP
ncbi:MAG: transporter substrate-binding domain-containing protein [Elusimicrobia bacterium]|nr:transporter substrate-binding domain-containing protein [Elusimicrobiota bacterium]